MFLTWQVGPFSRRTKEEKNVLLTPLLAFRQDELWVSSIVHLPSQGWQHVGNLIGQFEIIKIG
jgi:hypothetical protein